MAARIFRIAYIGVLLFICQSPKVFAQQGYPVPQTDRLLFYVQHNRGHNTFLYRLNRDKNGKPDRRNPIMVQRQLFDEDSAIKSLTSIQNRFAYGVKGKFVNSNCYAFSLAGYSEQTFYLDLSKSVEQVKTVVNGREVYLKRMFLYQTEGSSGLNTKLDYILFFGTNPSGQSVQEKLIL